MRWSIQPLIGTGNCSRLCSAVIVHQCGANACKVCEFSAAIRPGPMISPDIEIQIGAASGKLGLTAAVRSIAEWSPRGSCQFGKDSPMRMRGWCLLHRHQKRQSAVVNDDLERNHPMTAKTLGPDVGEDVFQVHCVSAAGRRMINKKRTRAKLIAFFNRLSRCVALIAACGSAHHRGRKLRRRGHVFRLMPAAEVKPCLNQGRPLGFRSGRC